ncbi:MAG: DUF3365 domain-containing protein [Clostridia bacterium]|nr:MAG: DUF3365 domain-containing protein [Clostridia bacterium]
MPPSLKAQTSTMSNPTRAISHTVGLPAWACSLTFRFMVAIVGGVLTILLAGFFWEARQQEQAALAQVRQSSKVMVEQILAVRAFMAANQDRINRDAHGNYEFKHMNPAAVIQGASEIFNARTTYTIKQTRLSPRLSANAPDAWEREQLLAFAANPGLQESYGVEERAGQRYFRYMVPLVAKEDCLPCHGEPAGTLDVSGHLREGYHLGDLAGALSITVPMASFDTYATVNLRYRLLLAIFLGGATALAIYFLMQRLVAAPLGQLAMVASRWGEGAWEAVPALPRAYGEVQHLATTFRDMAARLQELYQGLEEKVVERTAELLAANRQLEEQKRELQEAGEFKSRILANMSHELRTPLTSILALAELLEQGVAGPLTREQQEYIQDIQKSGKTLLAIINDILEMSRLQAGKMELNWEEFSIADIIAEAGRIMRPAMQEKQLSYSVNLAPDLPPAVGDVAKVKQVLLNLLSNAVKFTPPGGSVTVEAGPVPVPEAAGSPEDDLAPGNVILAVAVIDSGPGIPPHQRQVIFEPFRQLDNSARRRYPGTGLGLSVARGLVEMHGGSITVDEAPGGGSVFTFTIPARADLPGQSGSDVFKGEEGAG